MRKITLLILLFSTLCKAQMYRVDNFKSDIFSRETKSLKQIEISLIFEGEDIKAKDYKILDALNIVVSSFYIEDLFTSKGKERFKELLKRYILKKYMIDIDFIYIQSLGIKQYVDIDKIIDKIETQTRKELESSSSKEYKESMKNLDSDIFLK